MSIQDASHPFSEYVCYHKSVGFRSFLSSQTKLAFHVYAIFLILYLYSF